MTFQKRLAVPPIDFILDLITQSDKVLSSMDDKLSDVTPNSIISPNIDEIDAIVGEPTPSGRFSRTIEIRTLTICLAR